MPIRIPWSFRTSVNALPVYWLPWSVLNISARPLQAHWHKNFLPWSPRSPRKVHSGCTSPLPQLGKRSRLWAGGTWNHYTKPDWNNWSPGLSKDTDIFCDLFSELSIPDPCQEIPHLTGPVKRMACVFFINQAHKLQVLFRLPPRLTVVTGSW